MEGTEVKEMSQEGMGGQQLDTGFDYESIVIRRADPDDTDAIINLVEIGEDDHYNRVYSYPKILKLIETAYLGITVIDRDSGAVIAFAAFEDYPQGQRGMVDDRHYNYWEKWLSQVCQVEEFSSFNSLWLSYFIVGNTVARPCTHHVFRQVLQTVYTSLPDLIGVLFLSRGDADEDDIARCFDPIQRYFQNLEVKDASALSNVRGIHPESTMFFSSRIHVIPYIEVRSAKQEDHDDLADVFNSQSETVTEAYGEYFIAELIASQNQENRALVAQVKDKAIGLMGLTKEVDLKLLHKCFALDSFDNLLKPEFMEAVRSRRSHLEEVENRRKENDAIEAKKNFREETMRCNIIAQRMELQQHLLEQSDDILKLIDEFLVNEDESKEKLSKEFVVESMFNVWLDGYKVYQPTDYFLETLNEDDPDLEYNINSEFDFLFTTLEIFGLPKDYVNGKGHHTGWHKAAGGDDKKSKGKGKKKKAKMTGAAAKLAAKMGVQEEEKVRPTFFDLVPFQKALKKFLCCTPDVRSFVRCLFTEKNTLLRNVFKDKHGELSFKKVVDIHEFSNMLGDNGITVDGLLGESLGSMLICFGDIEVDKHWGDRPPPQTEDQKKAQANLNFKIEERKKTVEDFTKKLAKGIIVLTKEEEEKKAVDDEEEDRKIKELIEKNKPKSLIKLMLYETSIHDLLIALDRMAQYDRLLSACSYIKSRDWSQEDRILSSCGKVYKEEFVLLPEIEGMRNYSSDTETQNICEEIHDQQHIPEPPESAKNAFAITLFCMEAAFDSRSKDFLKYAFEAFPDRDYLIVTQPHTVAESSLLNKFTLVQKQSINTFQHVLYLIHRDYLFEQDISMHRTVFEDISSIKELIMSSGESEESAQKTCTEYEYTCQNEATAPYFSYTAKVLDTVVASFLISRDINLEYYVSHFHVQDQILMGEHERKGHARLVYSVVNPIFEKSTRFLLKEVLRLSGKTCLFFEVNDETIIPQIFHELVHVRSRRFPHFLDRKWDHEHAKDKDMYGGGENETENEEVTIPIDGHERNPIDEQEAPFALNFSTKRLLSEAKIVKNSRVVVVGASDTGISFIEALLSITYLHFTNIILVAPGGLPHHNVARKRSNLKATSTSYTYRELKKLMLESRVTVIDSRMTDIDRSDKNIILNDGRVVPYDTLVLSMGIQDKTLHTLNFVSQGIDSVPEGMKRIRGLLSNDDPYLYKFLAKEGYLMSKLTDRRRQTNTVVYGRSLNTYTLIQGLLDRGVQPKSITLAIPRQTCHVNEVDADAAVDEDMPWIYPGAFDDVNLEEKIQKSLEDRGITIVRECKLIEIISDKDLSQSKNAASKGEVGAHDSTASEEQSTWGGQLERIVLKRLDIPDEEEEEDEFEQDEKSHNSDEEGIGGGMGGGSGPTGGMEDSNLMENEDMSQAEQQEKRKKRKKNEMELECGVLVTCGHRDVDQDVFSSIHNNGLVYNGRLIVDQNFATTDRSIFAAGPLCEFSNKFLSKAMGRSLRMDRYNGREMGSRLARSVFDIYDPQSNQNNYDEFAEEIPQFYLPQGQGGVLPMNLIYYHIKTTNPLIFSSQQDEANFKNRPDLVCDNLDISTGKGHYIKFTFNTIGLISTVTYMGDEEVILQSLWSFVGLHENYLNQLWSREEAKIIPNVVEFLSENWAIALYHEWFGDFCLRMRNGIKGLEDVQKLLHQALEDSKQGLGINRTELMKYQDRMSPQSIKMIEDETLEFIKTNLNHLPMYYIPAHEFP